MKQTPLHSPTNGSRLIDPYNRNLCYLRVSVTDRCNLRCMYCMPPSAGIRWLRHDDILRYEEILRIIRVGVKLGVTKVRVTGGEPLVRKGIDEFLASLGRIPGLLDFSLTTNAVVLRRHLENLKAAGVRRLNISLDTLKREKFRDITGFDAFERVMEAISAARNMGFHPIKINVVAMNGVNDDELADLARMSLDHPLHIRFIEYMPIGDQHLDDGKRILSPEIRHRIEKSIGSLVPVTSGRLDGPAERFRFQNAPGEVGFIQPLSHHFCGACNRLRLTASGRLRPCLLSDRSIDLITPLRGGCSDEALADLFLSALRLKPFRHSIDGKASPPVHSVMSAIGG